MLALKWAAPWGRLWELMSEVVSGSTKAAASESTKAWVRAVLLEGAKVQGLEQGKVRAMGHKLAAVKEWARAPR